MPADCDPSPAPQRRLAALAARWLGIGLALLLAGCLVDSKNPIARPSADAIDPDILGTWGTQSEDGAVFFHVFQPTGGVPGAVEVIAVGFEKDKSGSVDRYCGHLSRIGKQHFINLIGPVEDCTKTEGEPYFFVAYDRTLDGVLTIRLMREDEIKKAVGSGKLAGEKDAGGGPTAHITADSAAIRAFILADTGALWDQALAPLRRVTPPAN